MIRVVFVSLLLVILTACLRTRAELEEEQSGQTQERQTQTQQRGTHVGATAPVKEKAPPAAYRFEEYDEQLRNLGGRVDTLENNVSQLNALKANDQSTASKDRQAIDQKFVAYEEALKKLDLQIQALADEVGKIKYAPPPPPAAPEKPALNGGKLKSHYDDGEEHFVAKKWKNAIDSFQKYRDANPKGKNYPDATYKIGISFQELGMKEEAKAFFEEVVAKFPKSKEAKKATLRMKLLK